MCRSSGTPQPKAKGGQKGKGGGKGANAVKTCWNCVETGHMSSQCPKKKKFHAVEKSTTASQVGSQDPIMVGLVESYFDVGSVNEVTLEPRSAGENICSMAAPNVREGESVDIEIDSGAEVSCLPREHRRRHVSTAPDEAQHVWRSPRCGWWRQTARAAARILVLEAANVPGDVVNLLVRFRSHEHWQSTPVNTRSEPLRLGDSLPCIQWKCVSRQESLGHPHRAREGTLGMVLESQGQPSQRVAAHLC